MARHHQSPAGSSSRTVTQASSGTRRARFAVRRGNGVVGVPQGGRADLVYLRAIKDA